MIKIFRVLEIVMLLGLAEFIIVTGVYLLPKIDKIPNSEIMVFTYSLSILLGATYFLWLIFKEKDSK